MPNMEDIFIIGEKYKKAFGLSLERLGVFVLWLPDDPHIDLRLSGHADLSAFFSAQSGLVLAPYLKETSFPKELDGLGIKYRFADISQSPKYPNDAQLNICPVGKYDICNPKTAYIDAVYGKVIPVRQGYSRCSVCVVSDNAIITADRGIAEAVGDKLDVLLISPGYVTLEGFESGFIGGAAFILAKDKLCFSGRIDGHPDKSEILAFLNAHGVEPVYLTDLPIFDFGSAIHLN